MHGRRLAFKGLDVLSIKGGALPSHTKANPYFIMLYSSFYSQLYKETMKANCDVIILLQVLSSL